MVPFECDRCIFLKLKNRLPIEINPQDQVLMAAIRRINLDAFWARTTTTVTANLSKIKQAWELSELVGLDGGYYQEGPLPAHDHAGYELAVQMVMLSRRPGRHSKTHTQFATIRKLRSAFSNFQRASNKTVSNQLALGNEAGRYNRLYDDPAASLWFSRFYDGCLSRMGEIWKPNRAMSSKLICRLIQEIDSCVVEAEHPVEKHRWTVFHTYVVVSYVISLRGSEGLLLDLAGLNRYVDREQRHVVLTLLGRVKGETFDSAHLFFSVNTTGSGIPVRDSVCRLMALHAQAGRQSGPAISDHLGNLYSTRALDGMFLEVIEPLFDNERSLFPPDIEREHLSSVYQVFRTLRKSSDSRALDMGVGQSDIDTVNRWSKVEKAGARRPRLEMRQHYAQPELLVKPFLRYTEAM